MKWITKNWKWLVPTFLAVLLCIALLFMTLLKSSDVYKKALEITQTDEKVIKHIGKPIKPGFIATGTIKWAGPSGSANISFPIRGPKNTGVVFGIAEKSGAMWVFHSLNVTLKSHYLFIGYSLS